MVSVQVTRPDHTQVLGLLRALDDYLDALYPPEANHILDVQALLAPDIVFLAAWRDDVALGCGALRAMPGELATQGLPYAEIKRMYVDPAARGERLGSRLLTALEQAAVQRGLALALLETGRDQHEAVRLYKRSGYGLRGPFGGYPDNGLSEFYEKRLVVAEGA